MTDIWAELRAMREALAPSEREASARGADPCARLFVTPVRGGIADAPIVKHAMVAKRDPECFQRPCRHNPACIPMFVAKCAGGACDCPPFTAHAAWRDSRIGTASKGVTPNGLKAGTRKLARPNVYSGAVPLSRRGAQRTPLSERMGALLLLDYLLSNGVSRATNGDIVCCWPEYRIFGPVLAQLALG